MLLSGVVSVVLTVPFAAQAGFHPHQVMTALPSAPHSVLTVDANGDGRDDVVVSTTAGSAGDAQNDYRLLVFLQRDDGTLAAPIRVAAGLAGTFANLAKADMNEDGVQDILVVHAGGVSVVLGSRTAAFSAKQTGWGDGSYRDVAGSLVTVDINRDGHVDVMATAKYGFGGDFRFFHGDGHGALTATAQPLATPGYYIETGRLYAGDLDSDGNRDVVIAGGGVHVLLHDGEAGFLMPPSAQEGYEAAVGDFSADGRDDLAIFLSSPSRARLYKQDATGALAVSAQLSLTNPLERPVVLDVDGDGDDDLIARSVDDRTISYYRQDSGLAHEADYPLPNPAFSHDAGDINHDGLMDVVVISASGLGVLRGGAPRNELIAGNDFNGDGSSDLFWRNASTWRNTIWNSAAHAAQTAVLAASADWFVAATDDFNGDGRTDVFWRNRANGRNDIWRSADGRFVESLTAVIDQGWQVAGTGDFDGDSRADILWRHATRGQNVIWHSGHSTTQLAITAVTNMAWSVASVSDFDGDGRADIFWHNGQTGANVIWRSGRSTAQVPLTQVTDTRWEIVGAGDFDGDGRSDIVWRHRESGRNAIWRSGNPATQAAITAVTSLDWKIAEVGDFDGDGHSDLAWRNTRSGANVIWKAADYRRQQSLIGVTDQNWQIAR
jgi:hypothetical protein